MYHVHCGAHSQSYPLKNTLQERYDYEVLPLVLVDQVGLVIQLDLLFPK